MNPMRVAFVIVLLACALATFELCRWTRPHWHIAKVPGGGMHAELKLVFLIVSGYVVAAFFLGDLLRASFAP